MSFSIVSFYFLIIITQSFDIQMKTKAKSIKLWNILINDL